MADLDSSPTTEDPTVATSRRPRTRARRMLTLLTVAAVLALVVHNARTGAQSPRIRNPDAQSDARPYPVLFGFEHWLGFIQLAVLLVAVAIVITCIVLWRRNVGRPAVLMTAAVSTLAWQDPIMNWACYAVYNPALWHWPEDWPLFSMSPTVEPFIVVILVIFFLAPYFMAVWILRRLQASRPPSSFVWQHPLITLSLLIATVGLPYMLAMEVPSVRTGAYHYSQVIPFGSLFVGTPYQYPLLTQVLVLFVMVPAGVLLYRDDTGQCLAERLAQRSNLLRGRRTLGTFVVMVVIVNIGFFAYGAGYAVVKRTGIATGLACPWPFPATKVYDPQGLYAQAGQPGPYFTGAWATWHGMDTSVDVVNENCDPMSPVD